MSVLSDMREKNKNVKNAYKLYYKVATTVRIVINNRVTNSVQVHGGVGRTGVLS